MSSLVLSRKRKLRFDRNTFYGNRFIINAWFLLKGTQQRFIPSDSLHPVEWSYSVLFIKISDKGWTISNLIQGIIVQKKNPARPSSKTSYPDRNEA